MHKGSREQLTEILGAGNYLDSMEDRATYAYDATGEKCLPEAVVFPERVEQVSRILAIANDRKIPVVPRGAGSGLTGGAVPLAGGIVMVMNRFNRILTIDTDNLQAIVEPGVITSKLHAAVEARGLFYPPDPASMTFCSIGGNIAENAGGMRAVKYGVTKDFVMGLEVVLPGGEVIHTGSRCIKDVVGYDLTRLFVGSEGTLGVITKAVLKLLPLPEAKHTLTATFDSMGQAAGTVAAMRKKGIIPTTLEFMDKLCIGAVEEYLKMGLPVEAEAMLLIEVDGRASEIESDLQRIRSVCEANCALAVSVAKDRASQEGLWHSRRSLHSALINLRQKWEEEDISVPVARIPDMVAILEKIGQKYDVLVASFGHAGDGNIHISIAAKDHGTADENIHRARREILQKAVAMEGRIAAEHGIGFIKRDKIGWNLDANTIDLMQNIKRLIDPHGILNPGKIFPSTIACSE